MNEDRPKLPLYGRKWRILVKSKSGTIWDVSDSSFDSDGPGNGSLRCTFRIEKFGYQALWYSDISIWNLRGDTQQDIVQSTLEGTTVIVEAGYVDGEYGKIFEGQVFQPLFDRQNVTDFITTLHCIDSMSLHHANFVSTCMQAGYKYHDVINTMSKNARQPIPLGDVTQSLDQKTSPRGKVLFGDPRRYLRNIARDNNAQYWFGDGKLHVSQLDDPYEGQTLVLTPQTGLVGTPQQTDDGVAFRCLLNPNLTVKAPPMVVKLDQAVIRQVKINQGMLVSPLDNDGTYKIVKVAYVGDTRGNDWYTECIGVNMAGKGSVLLGKQNS